MDTWNGKPLVPLDENEPLRAGDIILIKFRWLIDGAWYRAYEWSAIEKKLEGRKDWRVISYRNDGDYLWAEIEVLPQPAPELQRAVMGLPDVLITAMITATISYGIYALSHDREHQWKLVDQGKVPAPVSSVAQVSEGFKVLSYAALVVGGGWVLVRLFRR